MSVRELSPDVVALIHHVQLNESGWWRKAVAQLLRAVLWTQEQPIPLARVCVELRRQVGVSVSEDEVRRHLESLRESGDVKELNGAFNLSRTARGALDAARREADADQNACKQAFMELCEKHCPRIDAGYAWALFAKALAHAVRVTGANLYRLISDGRLLRDVDWPKILLNRVEPEYREGLRYVLAEFLGEKNDACRNVILRLMSAHFFAEATHLQPDTIAAIEKGRTKRRIKVVLDTNFVFSVLDLHDNPGDDSALSLLSLAQRGGDFLDVRLYVLPGTLEEAKRTLIYQQRLVQKIRATPNVARAALSQALPSIARKYFDTAAKAGGLTAEAYFDPYVSDLRSILQAKGINVLEISQQTYSLRQDVIDDTLSEQERENKDVPAARRKGYEKTLHDVVLWHAVNDRRQYIGDSPLEIEFWAVTIDWALMGFDRRKRQSMGSHLPVALHPSNLIQLIQFWLPRTPELEESLIDALRLPLLFESFDSQDEQATLKVLEAISRFENVDDLPESTLRIILANQALRGRLKAAAASNDEVFELVRDEMIAEHRETTERLAVVTESLTESQRALRDRESALTSSLNELNEVAARELAAQKALAAVEKAKDEASAERDRLREEADRLVAANAITAEQLKLQEQRFERGRFVALFYFLPLLGALAAVAALTSWQQVRDLPTARLALLIAGILLLSFALAACFAPRYVDRRSALTEVWFAGLLVRAGRWVLLLVGLAIAGIFQGAAWDLTKSQLIDSYSGGANVPPTAEVLTPVVSGGGNHAKTSGAAQQSTQGSRSLPDRSAGK